MGDSDSQTIGDRPLLGDGIGSALRGDRDDGAIGRADPASASVLIIADPAPGARLAADCADQGWRVMAVVAPGAAPAHLARLVRADVIWCDAAGLAPDWFDGPLGHALVARLDAGDAVVVDVAPDRIDAAVDWSDGQALCRLVAAPDRLERLATVAGLARARGALTLHDVSVAGAPDRLDQLQEEVARIARMLGQLTAREAGSLMSPPAAMTGTMTGAMADPAPGGQRVRTARLDDGMIGLPAGPATFGAAPAEPLDAAAVSAFAAPHLRAAGRGWRDRPTGPGEGDAASAASAASAGSPIIDPGRDAAAMVRDLIRLRRLREQYFSPDLFADPAWDMLLDLYVARLERQPVSVSSLCIAAAVPATTALRWIKTMTEAGLFRREADPRDGRRIFIALSDQSADAMDRFFAAARAGR